MPGSSGDARAALEAEVAGMDWYHTIEVAPGVLTPGWFDTRAAVEIVGFPGSLAGKRCLDVGTFDGFWAFEMERRGAAEVVAIDVLDPRQWDWPLGSEAAKLEEIGARKGRGEGFELVHRAIGSKVQRIERNVYDLDPSVEGEFDFVYVGSILLHLRDPVRALEKVRAVCRGDGLLVDAISLPLTWIGRRRPVAALEGIGRPWWWKPNLAGFARMAESAGFEVEGPPRRFYMPRGDGQPAPPVAITKLVRGRGWGALVTARRGDPHAAIRVHPAPLQ